MADMSHYTKTAGRPLVAGSSPAHKPLPPHVSRWAMGNSGRSDQLIKCSLWFQLLMREKGAGTP